MCKLFIFILVAERILAGRLDLEVEEHFCEVIQG